MLVQTPYFWNPAMTALPDFRAFFQASGIWSVPLAGDARGADCSRLAAGTGSADRAGQDRLHRCDHSRASETERKAAHSQRTETGPLFGLGVGVGDGLVDHFVELFAGEFHRHAWDI